MTNNTQEEIKNQTENPEQEVVDQLEGDGQQEETPVAETEQTLQTELAEMKDKYLRLYAEFDNYKRRTAKERVELIQSASKDLIKDLLPVWDDFERAFLNSSEEADNDQSFKEGMQLVYNKFVNTLKNKGVEPYDKSVVDFDPELHAAITEIPAPSEDMQGKIIDYVSNGYKLHDKVLRHAQVVIGK